MSVKEPIWYINKSTGLAIIRGGHVVEWVEYVKNSSYHTINTELGNPCPCSICVRVGMKRPREEAEEAYRESQKRCLEANYSSSGEPYDGYRADQRHEIMSYSTDPCDCDHCTTNGPAIYR